MIAIYTENITPRISFIVSTLFGDKAVLVDEISTFSNADAIKINYSSKRIDDSFQIVPFGLLTEKGCKSLPIEIFLWNDLPAFFKVEGGFPFDIFSAAFFLLSRYEEYLPHEKDEYGRFSHHESIAFKNQFLKVPLIDLWMQKFWEILRSEFLSQEKEEFSFQFTPTYDIDIAYRFLHHKWYRNAGGFLKDLLAMDGSNFSSRAKTLFFSASDPADVYAWLDALHQRYNLHPVYFFLLAERRKGFDKNLSPSSSGMKLLIRETAGKYAIGIHPSWQSGEDENILRKEISTLRTISQEDISLSRQHYIRMNLPETYRSLLKNGIRQDFSMGYGSINGFRASTSKPFYWYDLIAEKQTHLRIRPFCYMEANSIFEQKDSPQAAAVELQGFYDVIKAVNGELITIFHNHFLTDQREGEEWRKLYAHFLSENF